MKLFTLLTAAASLLIVSACTSTPAPTDERVKIEAVGEASAQPGIVYVSPDAAGIFTLRDIETEINESGYLAVRVFGKTCELSALKWAFLGDVDYEFAYRFYWLDADGNLVPEQESYRLRSTIPGDPVRFVGHAPTEEVRNFAMSLFTASEKPVSDGVEPADGEADEAAEADAETDAAEAEEEKIKEILPELPEQNVSGDKQDVKVIGISDKDAESVPKAVPAEKE